MLCAAGSWALPHSSRGLLSVLNLAHSLYSAAVKTTGFGLTSPPFAWGGNANSAAGPFIDENSALNLSAVFNATEIISNAIMVMPLMTYKRLDEQGKELKRDHPVFDLLHRRPNPHMHAARWKSLMMVWKLLWGNARSEIERNRAGRILNLWPIHPSRSWTFKDKETGNKFHRVWNEDGTQTDLPDSGVVHWMGMSKDGLNGMSRVEMGAESMGLAVAQEHFAARFFGNNAMPGIVITHPRRLTSAAKENMRKSWVATYGGEKALSPAILEEGVEAKAFQMPNSEAQFLESRVFSILEVARWFNISPHKLKELSRATFSNIESLTLQFVSDTVLPHAVENETETTRKLFSETEQIDGFFCEFKMDSLLRADAVARNKSLAIRRINGITNANEWRALDNEAPIPDGDGGSEYWRPKNMMVVGSEEDLKPSGVVFPQQNTDDALAAHETMLRDAIGRVNRNASNAIERAAKAKKEPDYIRLQLKFVEAVTPILESLATCVGGVRPDMLFQCRCVIVAAAESYLKDGIDEVDHAAIIMEQVRDCLCEVEK